MYPVSGSGSKQDSLHSVFAWLDGGDLTLASTIAYLGLRPTAQPWEVLSVVGYTA